MWYTVESALFLLYTALQMFTGNYRDFTGKSECRDFKFMGIACIPAIPVILKFNTLISIVIFAGNLILQGYYFFGYFNTLETHSVCTCSKDQKKLCFLNFFFFDISGECVTKKGVKCVLPFKFQDEIFLKYPCKICSDNL